MSSAKARKSVQAVFMTKMENWCTTESFFLLCPILDKCYARYCLLALVLNWQMCNKNKAVFLLLAVQCFICSVDPLTALRLCQVDVQACSVLELKTVHVVQHMRCWTAKHWWDIATPLCACLSCLSCQDCAIQHLLCECTGEGGILRCMCEYHYHLKVRQTQTGLLVLANYTSTIWKRHSCHEEALDKRDNSEKKMQVAHAALRFPYHLSVPS